MMHPATEQRRAVVALGGNAPLRRGEPLEAAYQALMGDAYKETEPYPLDVLDAETEGHIGSVLEMQLDNFIDRQDTVTVITRMVVDANDPAFESPSKFIARATPDGLRTRRYPAGSATGPTLEYDGGRRARVA